MKRLFLIISFLLLLPSFSIADDDVLLVVMAASPGESITGKTVERIYLKRKVLWGNSAAIVPVNLSSDNPLRAVFNEKVLKRSRTELVDYWNAEHFKGVYPPEVMESEEAVKKFVKEVPGAVGYISPKNLEDGLIVIYRVK